MKQLNCKVVSDSPYRMSNYAVYSDASVTGCGAHLDINGEEVCNKQWDLEERRRSSTWRELSAILFALHSFLPLLMGSYVKWFSDSQNHTSGKYEKRFTCYCAGDFSVLRQ